MNFVFTELGRYQFTQDGDKIDAEKKRADAEAYRIASERAKLFAAHRNNYGVVILDNEGHATALATTPSIDFSTSDVDLSISPDTSNNDWGGGGGTFDGGGASGTW